MPETGMPETPQDFWLAHLGEARGFNQWVMRQVEPLLGHRVLEIGCGIGGFTAMMAASGHAVTAVDINADYVAATRRHTAQYPDISVVQGDATMMGWQAEFDSVLMLDVLEHIADDIGFIQRLRDALKPGGTLVLKVPAGPWLYSPMDRAVGHHRRYTRQSLAQIFCEGGYMMSRCRPFNTVGILGWFVNGRLLGRSTPPAAQLDIFERLLPAVKAIDRLNPSPLGLSLIAAGTALPPAMAS